MEIRKKWFLSAGEDVLVALVFAMSLLWMLSWAAGCATPSAATAFGKAELALQLAKCVDTALTENAKASVTKPANLELEPPVPAPAVDAGTP